MATFITNSANTQAVRASSIIAIEIVPSNGNHIVQVKSSARPMDLTFEIEETLEAAQTKAAAILSSLEGA